MTLDLVTHTYMAINAELSKHPSSLAGVQRNFSWEGSWATSGYHQEFEDHNAEYKQKQKSNYVWSTL